ncbi:uncharacterized protein [Penaeus vannamei]|uniref:uncharacterized protein n=1 Tax=Penaeus vannamei TaxID=6689 RepID=UPI00387F8350
MASVPKLSMEDRVRVVVLHEEGNSCNKVAQKMKVARSTMQAIMKKHTESDTRKDREGRGRKKRTDRYDVIIISALRNRRQASNSQPNELRETFNTEVSARTVRRKWPEVLQSQENTNVD